MMNQTTQQLTKQFEVEGENGVESYNFSTC